MALPHTGSWGLPDFGITEWVSDKINKQRNSRGGSNLVGQPQAAPPPQTPPKTPPPTTPPANQPKNNGGTTTTNSNNNGGQQPGGYTVPEGPNVDDLARQQAEAAAAAAEAKRQAAGRKYQAEVQISQGAKDTAKGEYDWLVETLGSNKKDLLEQVATNEKTGLDAYQQQEVKTKGQYDGAKQEILSTYRDLGKQQEKIMRGAGLQSSSRQMEAQNRLNALMGKDLSQVSTNEADAIAMIGNAVSTLKNKTVDTNTSIERDAKSKIDKATLDYSTQIKAIDNNLYLSANEREDAYATAEAQLADDRAKISTWAAGVKANVETQKMQLKAQLDQFIMSMTDSSGLLTSGLDQKVNATNEFLKNAKYTPLDTETGAQTVGGQGGGYKGTGKTYANKAALDEALQSGELTPMEYNAQLSKLTTAPTGPVSTQDPLLASLMSGPTANSSAALRATDPLLAAL